MDKPHANWKHRRVSVSTHKEPFVKKILSVLVLCFFATPAPAADMKPGLWEIKTLRQVVDGQDIHAQMQAMQKQLAALPAAQRKQMEAMMAGQGVGMSDSGAVRICISEEAARRNAPVIDPKGECQPRMLTRSGNTVRFEIDCTMDGRRTQGKGESTFSGDSVHSRMDMTTTGPDGHHSMQTESRMTYLGPDCKGLAPLGGKAKAR